MYSNSEDYAEEYLRRVDNSPYPPSNDLLHSDDDNYVINVN